MCGIAGVLTYEADRSPSREGLQRMADVLAHRGPDEQGFYLSGPIGFAHRRLRIIDLVSGQQPMTSPDGNVCLIYNGEIYNYPELKAELEQRGYVFRTRSDTEVLLALYLYDGLEAFPKVNGMFACALWDWRTRQLVLARDRFGKKPLFYYHDAHTFVFGSELKALLAYGGIARQVNLSALHEYLTYSYIVGEQTIIEGIYRLPPAHVLVVRNGQATCRSYWDFTMHPAAEPLDEVAVVEHLEELLTQAVKRRLLSDVPLGAFLSGGIDSSVVVALMAQLSDRPVQTFTVGFEEAAYSELDDARVVARHLGTDHHEMIVKPAAFDILPRLVWHLDEPFGDSSAVPTYYVCQAARQHVTVALSGDGGDEVFAGYARYQALQRYQHMARLPAWLKQGLIKPLTAAMPFTWPGWNYLYALGHFRSDTLPEGLGIYPYIQEKLYSPAFQAHLRMSQPHTLVQRLLQQAAHLDPVSRYQYVDTLHYLPADILTKVDRMSMANALEVRSPLLDVTLVEYVATLPLTLKLRHRVSKYVLRKLCRRLLPDSVLTKRKQGFALPKDRWFQKELRTMAEEILLDSRTLARGYFRPRTLQRLLQHHATGRRDYSGWIWCLIVLEMWFRMFLDPSQGHVEQGPVA
ncbi:MAG: asparagine synthase (glutamine-hydrolyzing) [candidate division KSB1 bacterium]|nr:asparagine synthase (glutamine-hydrolyzing) [candidate division KSB1 bacterium]